ncbi:YopX family protein [Lactiplantibacillus plantarum]|uniref:YopX family protein n=1 Tax=Lactiplantibacillus plantarum TaxID=1590 RepID=UPI000FF8D40C|nr:YopX family protein [Lactiplantibacillus plantarum]QAS26485.1 hypothetical protein EQK26_05175 [Lactiplantibacillus plantarum]
MIKFRAWNGYRKIMADYVSAIQNGDTQGTPSSVNVIVNGKNETWDIKNDDVELLQFTGLTDVNGKDIYEGDIVENERGEILRVYYSAIDASFVAGNCYFGSIGAGKDIRVIGNVHANPELLVE